MFTQTVSLQTTFPLFPLFWSHYVQYAMEVIKANVFASQYLTALPDEETLRNELLTTQRALSLKGKQHPEQLQPEA